MVSDWEAPGESWMNIDATSLRARVTNEKLLDNGVGVSVQLEPPIRRSPCRALPDRSASTTHRPDARAWGVLQHRIAVDTESCRKCAVDLGDAGAVMRPKGVLLDFDETLFDNSWVPASVERTCAAVANALGAVGEEELLAANTRAWLAYWPAVERRCWVGEMDMLDVSREAWRRSLSDCGCDDVELVDLAFETHQAIGREMSRVFDDVHGFLRVLHDAGIVTALVTNSSARAQRAKLATVGLDSAFTTVVISGDIGIAKPDPRIFRIAVKRLALEPPEVWHIGDSLTTDVAGARAAGIESVWLNRTGRARGSGDPLPDREVESLNEVTELFR